MSEDEILKCVICLILGYMFAKYFRFGEGFSPSEVMDTSLGELNKSGCCVGNTAGYSVLPQAVSKYAPGFARIGAFSNPCMPMN